MLPFKGTFHDTSNVAVGGGMGVGNTVSSQPRRIAFNLQPCSDCDASVLPFVPHLAMVTLPSGVMIGKYMSKQACRFVPGEPNIGGYMS